MTTITLIHPNGSCYPIRFTDTPPKSQAKETIRTWISRGMRARKSRRYFMFDYYRPSDAIYVRNSKDPIPPGYIRVTVEPSKLLII